MIVTQKNVDTGLEDVGMVRKQVVVATTKITSLVRPNCKLSNLSNGSFTIRSCHVLTDF